MHWNGSLFVLGSEGWFAPLATAFAIIMAMVVGMFVRERKIRYGLAVADVFAAVVLVLCLGTCYQATGDNDARLFRWASTMLQGYGVCLIVAALLVLSGEIAMLWANHKVHRGSYVPVMLMHGSLVVALVGLGARFLTDAGRFGLAASGVHTFAAGPIDWLYPVSSLLAALWLLAAGYTTWWNLRPVSH